MRAIHLASLDGGMARGVRQVTYIHLLFDAHQIIFADGAPSESFYLGRMALAALAKDARRELSVLFPDLLRGSVDTVYGGRARALAGCKHLPQHLRDTRTAAI